MARRLALAATLAVLVVVLAPSATATTVGSAAAPFPVTITAANGKVTLSKRPARIVSLSATATETLFAIGAGRQVVAVDDQSDYPKTAPKTALSGYTPNVEAIAGYRPDLVVVAYDPKDLVTALERLGIPVIFHKPAATLAGAYQQMRQLGRVTGHGPQTASLVSRMKGQIARIVAKRKRSAAGLSVYHELDPTLFSANSNTFAGRVYSLFGLKNIADAAPGGSDYPQLSAEYVVASNPDLVVLADSVCCGQNASTVAARPGWAGVKAVRNRSILRIDDAIASRWGPRLVNFVRAIGLALGRLQS
jgi:iron complex transport system substrate-binding protein